MFTIWGLLFLIGVILIGLSVVGLWIICAGNPIPEGDELKTKHGKLL